MFLWYQDKEVRILAAACDPSAGNRTTRGSSARVTEIGLRWTPQGVHLMPASSGSCSAFRGPRRPVRRNGATMVSSPLAPLPAFRAGGIGAPTAQLIQTLRYTGERSVDIPTTCTASRLRKFFRGKIFLDPVNRATLTQRIRRGKRLPPTDSETRRSTAPVGDSILPRRNVIGSSYTHLFASGSRDTHSIPDAQLPDRNLPSHQR